MPIKGFSDQHRFTRAGHIRLGIKKVSQRGTEYPEKTDYFVFDPTDETLKKQWVTLNGEKPTRIDVALPSNNFDECWDLHYKCYGGNGLVCKGDGEFAERYNDGGDRVKCACPEPENCEFALARGKKDRDGNLEPGCKRVGRLSLFLPDLPTLSIFELQTSGRNSCLNIQSGLRDLFFVLRNQPAGVPFQLHLNPEQKQHPKTGRKVLVYVVSVVIPVSLKQLGACRSLLDLSQPLPQLPPPSDDIPEDLYPSSTVREVRRNQGMAPEFNVDPDTGEVLDDDSAEEPAHAPAQEAQQPRGAQRTGQRQSAPPEPAQALEDDPDVKAALAQFTPAKARALLASAKSGGWDKDRLMDVIGKQETRTPAEPQQRRRPQPEPTPEPEPEHKPEPEQTAESPFASWSNDDQPELPMGDDEPKQPKTATPSRRGSGRAMF